MSLPDSFPHAQPAAPLADGYSPLPRSWLFDCTFRQNGIEYVIGVDEAGRGCLAGPIFAAAVILPSPIGLAEISDSKRLTARQREIMAEEIKARALAWAVAWASPREIDRRGIDWANRIVFTRAIRQLQSFLPLDRRRMHVLVDGVRPALRCPLPQTTIKRGDEQSLSIGAASILAKTSRDRYCVEIMHARYPQYGFDRHKGYATRDHKRALQEWGPSKEHRHSFSW